MPTSIDVPHNINVGSEYASDIDASEMNWNKDTNARNHVILLVVDTLIQLYGHPVI